jgi:protein-S-isoprenylcysteine O-methyltransferase Ste14
VAKLSGEKSAFVAATVFYCLVAFEFFYMASPFAAYIYGVYGPGLTFAEDFGALNWIVRFFMPHLARETSSPLINYHEYFGFALFVGGLLAFLWGAVQVYTNKLRGTGAVTGWLYRHIRHPQYLALMISGLGMVLVWPRYLVLISFVTMVFIYVFLARTEEAICLRKFPGYAGYLDKTGMFLPRRLEGLFSVLPKPSARWSAVVAWITGYAVVMALSLGAAYGVNLHAIRSLYGVFDDDMAIMSVGYLEQQKLDTAVELAMADFEVLDVLKNVKIPTGQSLKLIGYILPTDFYVSEIPMQLPEGESFGHHWPTHDSNQTYKLILTKAAGDEVSKAKGRTIILTATNKQSLIEVHLDIEKRSILKRLQPPGQAFYGGMPVPIY